MWQRIARCAVACVLAPSLPATTGKTDEGPMNRRILWELGQWRCETWRGRQLFLFKGDKFVTAQAFDRPEDVSVYAEVWRDAIGSLETGAAR